MNTGYICRVWFLWKAFAFVRGPYYICCNTIFFLFFSIFFTINNHIISFQEKKKKCVSIYGYFRALSSMMDLPFRTLKFAKQLKHKFTYSYFMFPLCYVHLYFDDITQGWWLVTGDWIKNKHFFVIIATWGEVRQWQAVWWQRKRAKWDKIRGTRNKQNQCFFLSIYSSNKPLIGFTGLSCARAQSNHFASVELSRSSALTSALTPVLNPVLTWSPRWDCKPSNHVGNKKSCTLEFV